MELGRSISSDESAVLRTRDRLNEQTRGTTQCAWPDCGDKNMRPVVIRGTSIPARRVGVLCEEHAQQVAIAVIEDHAWAQRMHEALTRERVTVDNRGLDSLRREEERIEEMARRRADKPGFVYYIQIGDRLKIGFSVDVRKRMRAYPPESRLLAVEPGSVELERERHRQFKGSLTHGREWFSPTADLLEHIDAVLVEHGPPPRSMSHHYGANRQKMRIRRS